MKRKRIIKTINDAGELLDNIYGALHKNVDTGKYLEDPVTDEEIKAMQTALCMCIKLIERDKSTDPADFAIALVATHAALKINSSADESGSPDEGDADD